MYLMVTEILELWVIPDEKQKDEMKIKLTNKTDPADLVEKKERVGSTASVVPGILNCLKIHSETIHVVA